jgi:Tol biopolymer transport system component
MQKNNLLNIRFIMSLIFLLMGCRSGQVQDSSNLPLPQGYNPPEAKALTSIGSNTGGIFSSDGKKIYFISQDRTNHNHPQIYELDLNTQKERRLTFQDGHIYDLAIDGRQPQYLWYTSSTDEIKENPAFIRDSLAKMQPQSPATPDWKNFLQQKLPRTEIYKFNLTNHEIQRMTEENGFDGDLAFHPKKNEIAFVSVRGDQKRIWRMNLNDRKLSPLTPKALGVEDESPQYSPDGKNLIWVRLKSDRSGTDLWLADQTGNTQQVLLTGIGYILSPVWHPNGQDILFAANRDVATNYEIYSVFADGKCLRRLTFHSKPETRVRISPDGNQLLFTRQVNEQDQIFISAFSPPPCPAEVNPVQSGP